MYTNIVPTLPQWLDPDPVPKHQLSKCPSLMFERGLMAWERCRGKELELPYTRDYRYYISQLKTNLDNCDNDFEVSERVRREARKTGTDPDDPTIYHWATPPQHGIECTAYDLGWRLVPFARWYALLNQMPAFSYDVEYACRGWAARADAVWLVLVKMPRTKLATASHRAFVAPIRSAARELETRVREHTNLG